MVRSSTFCRMPSSSARCWAGARSSSNTTASASSDGGEVLELGDLAAADVGGRVGRVAALHDPFDDDGAGGVEQRGQLVEGRVDLGGGAAGQLHADDHGPLDGPDDVDALLRGALLDDVAALAAFLGAGQPAVLVAPWPPATFEVALGTGVQVAGVVAGCSAAVAARPGRGLRCGRWRRILERSGTRSSQALAAATGRTRRRRRANRSARWTVATSVAGPRMVTVPPAVVGDRRATPAGQVHRDAVVDPAEALQRDDGRACAGPAGGGLADPALPDAQADRAAVDHLDEPGVDLGGEARVGLDPGAERGHRRGVHVVDDRDRVRVAHRDHADEQDGAVDVEVGGRAASGVASVDRTGPRPGSRIGRAHVDA